jgi:hypothetical protein
MKVNKSKLGLTCSGMVVFISPETSFSEGQACGLVPTTMKKIFSADIQGCTHHQMLFR